MVLASLRLNAVFDTFLAYTDEGLMSNGIEIERKFFVLNDNWRPGVLATEHIQQGYVLQQPLPLRNVIGGRTETMLVTRVRIVNDATAFFTTKFDIPGGLKRFEIEKEIDIDLARQIMTFISMPVLTKTRYKVPGPDQKHVFEIDVFEGDNSGLVVCEVELESESDKVILPTFLGPEIVHGSAMDKATLNSNLASLSFLRWPAELYRQWEGATGKLWCSAVAGNSA